MHLPDIPYACLMRNVLLAIAFLGCLFGQMTRISAQPAEAQFPEPYNSERELGEPLSPVAALASLKLPAGFTASLFAAEPQVQNPIAATVDARGRIWVAENYTYAERTQRFDLQFRDRVVVLEDLDGDGQADRRTVFTDAVQMLTGIVVGQGGVWLMCPPQLLFVPDANEDLVPDGPPQVKLDGFHVARENYHNFANGLSWGPDSWLYGRCGASCPGEMGLPGTTDQERVPIRGGIWRFHPQRQVVEALTQGTTNPWGHDWNEVGELFFINTVNGHLWHAIQGAHFVRPHTLDANPFCYQLIDMHADHWHFDTGKSWTDSRNGAANDYGGGHAHVGMMIYQEAAWPQQYHGRLMTVNMHGRRINCERLDPVGSGYLGRHEPDFVLSDDLWFRGMELLPLPDGNVLLLDWSDTGECHEASGVHRTSGRIFKLAYSGSRSAATARPDTSLLHRDPLALATLQTRGSEWEARRARELLRGLKLSPTAAIPKSVWDSTEQQLEQLLQNGSSPRLRLRGLFGLWAIDRMDQQPLMELLQDPEPALRTWAIRLLTDRWPIDNTVGARPIVARPSAADLLVHERLVILAQQEPAASVRLTLASTLQRLPLDWRPALAEALMSHPEDSADHNLPLMVWYGLMPLPGSPAEPADLQGLQQLVALACTSQWSQTRQLIARRVSDMIALAPQATDQLISAAVQRPDLTLAADIVLGMSHALAGRRQLAMPSAWPNLQHTLSDHESPAVQKALADLNVLFGDGVAIEDLKLQALSSSLPIDQRRAALQSLVEARAPGLREMCLKLLKQRYLNVVAARGLADEQEPAIGQELLTAFRSFAPLDRPQIVSILASRPQWAELLLKAVGTGAIERHEINPFQARQIASLNTPELDKLLTDFWGQVRETNAERQQQIADLKDSLTDESLKNAHLGRGRSLFAKSCAPCHTLYGEGGKLGPDLTGAQRSNLDYLLENIVDPSAVVTKEFRATVLRLHDGRVLTGLVTTQSDKVLTLATQDHSVQIDQNEIEEIVQTAQSTMPEGLLAQLTPEQVRDLFAYLRSTRQVPPE
jgi:putative membrane-bound dehydrogenase-like protein